MRAVQPCNGASATNIPPFAPAPSCEQAGRAPQLLHCSTSRIARSRMHLDCDDPQQLTRPHPASWALRNPAQACPSLLWSTSMLPESTHPHSPNSKPSNLAPRTRLQKLLWGLDLGTHLEAVVPGRAGGHDVGLAVGAAVHPVLPPREGPAVGLPIHGLGAQRGCQQVDCEALALGAHRVLGSGSRVWDDQGIRFV